MGRNNTPQASLFSLFIYSLILLTGTDDLWAQKTRTFSDGTTYTGELKRRKPNGIGLLTKANGETYKGSFVDGVFDGKGTYTWLDGSYYTGDYVMGNREGHGQQGCGQVRRKGHHHPTGSWPGVEMRLDASPKP